MKSFNSTASNEKWRNKIYARKDVKSCSKNHTFCHVQYEWGGDNQNKNQKNYPIVPGYNNFQFTPQPAQRIKVRADCITQQSLDDWIAQSLNRPLKALLHPQRRFMIPGNLQTYLKDRYNYKKIIKFAKAGDQQSKYFNQQSNRKKKKINRGDKKAIIDEQEVKKYFFDYRNLQPNTEIPGTQIRLRQLKTETKKQVKRRNAVLLNSDVHYERFLKEISKDKKIDILQPQTEQKLQQFDINQLRRQKLYSYNLASLSRKDCLENVPSSVIERQIQIVRGSKKSFLDANRQFLNKQEEVAEAYRMQLIQKTKNGIKRIQEIFHPEEKKEKNKSFSTQGPGGVKRNQSIHKHNLSTVSQKQKSKLQTKVIKLLNNMQVVSEKVDVNMVKFNVHCVERKLQNVDSRPQIKWILKAQQKITQKQNVLAIDCYKQAIILQPQFFIPVFNIAVLLQKENMFQAAKLWFSLANQFEASDQSVQFGLALVLVKQLKYSDGLKQINDLIQQLENGKKKIQIVYYYLRALCYKQLGYLDEAKADYQVVDKQSQPANYNILGHFIFSRLFARIRRIPLQFDCLSYMKFRETIFLVLFQNKKKIKEDKQSLDDIADKLINAPFFCRFAISLVKKLLKVATYQRKQKNQIIFLKQTQTIIILSGIVSMKSHQKNFLRPETVGVLKAGGLVGTSDISKTASEKPNIWYLSDSDVQLIKIPRPLFNDFWKGQITFQFDFKFNFLRNIGLLKGLPQTTLFKLCQYFEKRTFEKNTILFNDCSYRSQLINKHGHGFGLGKIQETDHRFISTANLKSGEQNKDFYKKKNRSKIYTLIKKNIFKFNAMKFSSLKYPGLFVIQNGFVELENDKGFRCNGLIGEGQFFGENLLIDSEGLQKYGRLKVQTQTVDLWFIPREKLIWAFTQQDKQIMAKNVKNRQIIQTIRYLSNRYTQCQKVKLRIKETSLKY